jgi:tetratricopeptide (TPR) repeat protein
MRNIRFLFSATIFCICLLLLAAAVSAQPPTPRPTRPAAAAPAATPTPFNAVREADRLFSHGEDAARDRQALETVERALMSDAQNYDLLWRQARACYYVGDEAAASDKLKFFERGIAAGQKAVALRANGVEGHFWLGVAYGGFSEVKGALKALQTVKKIRAEMETVLKLHAAYEDGNAYLALGEMDRELPRLFGGDIKRSISYLEKGLSVAPRNTNLKLALAKSYIEAGRRDEARRQLEEILQTPVNPAHSKEQKSVQEKARKLLDQ